MDRLGFAANLVAAHRCVWSSMCCKYLCMDGWVRFCIKPVVAQGCIIAYSDRYGLSRHHGWIGFVLQQTLLRPIDVYGHPCAVSTYAWMDGLGFAANLLWPMDA